MNKIIYALIAIILVLGTILVVIPKGGQGLGSATHFSGPIDSEEGFTVDDVERISGTGGITATTGVFTGETRFEKSYFGGALLATTTNGSGTTTASDLCTYGAIQLTPTAATTLYLDNTTNLYADCLTANGDKTEILLFHEGANTAVNYGITITKPWTIAEGGIDIRATSSDAVVLRQGEIAKMTLFRESNTTTTIFIDGYSLGD